MAAAHTRISRAAPEGGSSLRKPRDLEGRGITTERNGKEEAARDPEEDPKEGEESPRQGFEGEVLKMSRYGLSEVHAVCPDDALPGISQEMCHNLGDLMYSEHSHLSVDPGLVSTDATLEDNLDRLSLSSHLLDDSSDSDSLPSLQDLGLMCPRAPDGSDQAVTKPRLDGATQQRTPGSQCRVCGKVFSSASSLSKHYLTHSQKRTHICKVCSKGFKRQDHLTGHMLTHLKTKPFVCVEQGCNKSYCDFRSLRRHCEVQHGVCAPKDIPCPGVPQPQDGPSTGVPTNPSPSNANLRCLVTNIVAPNVGDLEEQNFRRSSTQSSQKPFSKSKEVLNPCASFQNNCSSSGTFTLINKEATSSIQHSTTESVWLDLWPSASLTSVPVFHSQKTQPKQNFLVRSTAIGSTVASTEEPKGCKPKEICVESGVPPSVKESANNLRGSFSDRELGYQSKLTENTFQQDPIFTKLVLQPQDQNPGAQRLLHFISTSQQMSHHPIAGPPPTITILPRVKHQSDSLFQPIKENVELSSLVEVPRHAEFGAALSKSSTRAQDRNTSEGLICIPKNLINVRTSDQVGVGQTQSGKPVTSDGETTSVLPVEKRQASNSEDKAQQRRLRRPSTYRQEKMKFNLSNTASPSQVALASFSVSSSSTEKKSNLTIFNRIQGGNIYQLPSEAQECARVPGCPRSLTSSRGNNESQAHSLDCTQQCLISQGPSTPQRDEQTAMGEDLEDREKEEDLPSQTVESPARALVEDAVSSPLVIPVSVPVSEVETQQETTPSKRVRKKRPVPKALFIPPPLLEGHVPSSASFQSNLRSPNTYLSEHLHNGLFHYPPYTPPPMLSPIRQGTGLYFSTLCPPAAGADSLITSLPDKERLPCRTRLVRDDTVFTIQPHINIGDRFQAEIPDLMDTALREREEEKADLLWRPWLDTGTVSHFLNLACSSAVPGGGANLELALHCLHQAQGNVMDALDMLLIMGPQKSLPQSIVNYHYAGCDYWTVSEKRLFKRMFWAHKKDFSLIQSMIPRKDVHQCIEYYYTWKKLLNFGRSRCPGPEQKAKITGEVAEEPNAGKDESSETIAPEQSTPERKTHEKRQKAQNVKGSSPCHPPDAMPPAVFACAECERVFHKIKSRNAHMKRHRQQDAAEPSTRLKLLPKHPTSHENQPVSTQDQQEDATQDHQGDTTQDHQGNATQDQQEDPTQDQQRDYIQPITSLNYWH